MKQRFLHIKKNESIIKTLNAYLDSEHAKPVYFDFISDYLECPLKFFFNKISDLERNNKIIKNFDKKTNVSLIINELYNSYLEENGNKELNSEDLDKLINKAKIIIQKYIENNQIQQSEKDEISKTVENILLCDKKHSPFEFFTEKTKDNIITQININGKILKLSLKNNFFGVDKKDKDFRIIIYDNFGKDYEIKALENILYDFGAENKIKVYGLLYQAYILSKTICTHGSKIEILVYDLLQKDFKRPTLAYNAVKSEITENLLHDMINTFFDRLTSKFEQIFMPESGFLQEFVTEKCIICNYNKICVIK